MNGKIVAGIVLILAVINLFALMWYQIVFLEVAQAIFPFIFITSIIATLSAFAFGDKKQ